MTNDELKEKLTDTEVLFLTLVGEARGEPVEGQIAIGNVIYNRSKNRKLTIKDICLQKSQFSCWNEFDVNRKLLEELAKEFVFSTHPMEIYRQVWWVAEGIMKNNITDNTKGRDHYMTSFLYNSIHRPNWAKFPLTEPIKIGNHTFLNV